MSEHNEPWRVITSEPCIGIWQNDYCIADLTDMNIPWEDKVAIAHRIVLEHGACAGMSDEDIKEAMKEFGDLNTVIKRMADVHDALKADLNEALELLERILEYGYKQSLGYDVSIKAILDKHKEGK